MAVTDLKVSLRKRGATDFDGDGYRLLPVTKPQYVIGLLGSDGKLNSNLMPGYILGGMSYLGIADLDEQSTIDVDGLLAGEYAGMATAADAVGSYLQITSAGFLTNTSGNSAKHEIIGGGDEGDVTFPIHLEVGDWLVLSKVDVGVMYSWSIVNNTYELASESEFGVVKLINSVASASEVLVPVAANVKAAYDLAYGKKDDFAENNAFNKTFGTSAGQVAEGNHAHGTFDITQGASSNVLKEITVLNGIVTAAVFGGITTAQLPMDTTGTANVIWSGLTIQNELTSLEGGINQAQTDAANARKQGLEYYTSEEAANGGSHNLGDVVAVLEA